MKKVVICADAYPRIRNSLYIISQNIGRYPITVIIPGGKDLFKFFEIINRDLFNNDIEIIYYSIYKHDPRREKATGWKRLLYILPDMMREKRFLKNIADRYLRGFADCDVYILSRGFSDFYVAKQLAKRNRLTYLSSYPSEVTPRQYSPRNLMDLASLLIYQLVFGRGIALGELPHTKGFPHISDRFLEKEFDRIVDGPERDELLKDFDLGEYSLYDTGKYSVIYFDDGFIGTDFLSDDDRYKQELDSTFAILEKYFPAEEIACKFHPDYGGDKTFIKSGNIIPDHIPAEVLYNKYIRLYIGTFSSALANVEDGLVISLIDIIPFRDDETRKHFREMLIKMGKTEIRFPGSLDELEKILIDIKKQVDV